STIHRALEYAGGAGADRWGRNEHYPLDADLVVIDEASMLDLLLAHHLVKAVRRGAHLLFVGDADQLPSVGPGAVLRDLLASGAVPSLHLDTIFRQAADSGIIANAHAINGGAAPDAEAFPDFFFFPRAEAERCAAMVVELVTSRVPRQFPGLDPQRDIQVLAATHRGPAGVAELNTRLQQALNPPDPRRAEAQIGNNLYRVGDRVIQLRNNYDLDVSNGDMGVITALDSDERTLTVQYDDVRSVTYQWSELDELALAYVISIHKSQGAEYPAVVVPLLRYYGQLLQRSLLYTAVTRARELVVLTGDWKAVEQAVANQKTNGRVTALERRLRGE
ncbi:MAG TPA: AAA family ATPase, partial [Herpetosiphonaceae bacterium]